MRLAITAARYLARDEAHEHLQLFGNRALVKDGFVELHKRPHDVRPSRHRLDAVGREAAGLFVM